MYAYTRTKKKISLKKNDFVTLIPVTEAFNANGITIDVMNRPEPISGVTAYRASPAYESSCFISSEDAAEAIDANTSGAPLPNANKVTPANDSGTLKAVAICSSAGDK